MLRQRKKIVIDNLIIADDITGANSTGILVGKTRKPIYTVFSEKGLELFLSSVLHCDVVVSTNSRNINREEAYHTVSNTLSLTKGKQITIFKRIDSTLRGNIGAEIEAIQDFLGTETTACIVPSFPSSGRTVKNGILYVNEIPLSETSVKDDPLSPVFSSSVKEIIELQTKRKIVSISLDTVRSPLHELEKKIVKASSSQKTILSFDAMTDKDIEIIAKACISSGTDFFPVDPGPFTAAVISQRNAVRTKPVLAFVGSVNQIATVQIEYLGSFADTKMIKVDSNSLIHNGEKRDEEIDRVEKLAINMARTYRFICLYSSGTAHITTIEDRATITASINQAFATIASRLLERIACNGLFTCGGDTTMAICEALEVNALELLDEIAPLTVSGKLSGGLFDGLRLITKGGMVGEQDIMRKCLVYLQEGKKA